MIDTRPMLAVASAVDTDIIIDIAHRVKRELNADAKIMQTVMDLTAVHMHCGGLRLSALLIADGFNFAHDINGITHCLNRQELRLENCFTPRFTAKG